MLVRENEIKKKSPGFGGPFEFIVVILYNTPLLKSRPGFKEVVIKIKEAANSHFSYSSVQR
jgi:hypothetical protein